MLVIRKSQKKTKRDAGIIIIVSLCRTISGAQFALRLGRTLYYSSLEDLPVSSTGPSVQAVCYCKTATLWPKEIDRRKKKDRRSDII